MDFTSDLVESSSVAEGESDLSDVVEQTKVSGEELRRLELEEQKERLLRQRNLLIKEVEVAEKELGELRSKSRTVVDKNAMDTLIDVLSFSQRRKEEDEVERLLDSSFAGHNTTINGWSDVQEELQNKYDSLPLLNMNLRLRYLRDLYKGVEIITHKNENSMGQDPVVLDVEFLFHRFEMGPFRVQLVVKYDDIEQTLKEFVVKHISPEVELQLQPLRAVQNPSFFLTACFEFDKIRQRRYELLRVLVDKYKKRISRCELPRTGEYAIFETLDVLKNRKISVRIDFHIMFESTRLKYTPYPTSRLTYILRKNDTRVLVNEIGTIASGLIREYGLDKGLDELLNVCLFAELYK